LLKEDEKFALGGRVAWVEQAHTHRPVDGGIKTPGKGVAGRAAFGSGAVC